MSKTHNYKRFCPKCEAYQFMAQRQNTRSSSGLVECSHCQTPLRYNSAGRSVMAYLAILLTSLVTSQFFLDDGQLPQWVIYPVLGFPIYLLIMMPFIPKMVEDKRVFNEQKQGQIAFTAILTIIAAAVLYGLIKSL